MIQKHIPVLLHELVSSIEIFADKKNIIIDCTLWLWWHAKEIIKKMNSWDIFIGFDADERNLALAMQNLQDVNKNIELIFFNTNFVNLKKSLAEKNISKITWIYYDLWISSLHIDEAKRWFSFNLDWPLDMRFDTKNWKTAAEILNNYSEEKLAEIFKKYWEETFSKLIAKKIVEKRKSNFIFEKTKDLADELDKISKNTKTKARIFQALRIEVNNELENLKISLNDAIDLLEKDWTIFVISFHSLEDRIVKNIFRNESKDCICEDLICTCGHKRKIKIINKNVITPTDEEIVKNNRARSAKARLAKKL